MTHFTASSPNFIRSELFDTQNEDVSLPGQRFTIRPKIIVVTAKTEINESRSA